MVFLFDFGKQCSYNYKQNGDGEVWDWGRRQEMTGGFYGEWGFDIEKIKDIIQYR